MPSSSSTPGTHPAGADLIIKEKNVQQGTLETLSLEYLDSTVLQRLTETAELEKSSKMQTLALEWMLSGAGMALWFLS